MLPARRSRCDVSPIGRTWTFTASDIDTAGEFFAFNTAGYGIACCFIFRPNPSSISYAAGDQFDVTLSGGIYARGDSDAGDGHLPHAFLLARAR